MLINVLCNTKAQNITNKAIGEKLTMHMNIRIKQYGISIEKGFK